MANTDSKEPRKRRVLVVDDSPAVAAYLRTLLPEERFLLDDVLSAEEARTQLTAHSYDLLLLDLELPGMHGMDFLKELRASNNQLVVVILTAKGSVPVALEAIARGADGFIQKQESFAAEIEHLLLRAEEHRQGLLLREQLNQLRSDFYAAITHDLRSPVGSAMMALELLEEGVGGGEGREEMIRIIRSNLTRATTLIDRYLDYERIDEGLLQIRREPCDLSALVDGVVYDLRVQALGRSQTLVYSGSPKPVVLSLDPERMIHVAQNLVSNALRYTPEGGRVEVGVETRPNGAVLFVSDNGVGVPKSEQARIFEKFYRSGSGQRAAGAGLGLLIAREIVSAHNGSLRVESTGIPGEGSRFIVELPSGN